MMIPNKLRAPAADPIGPYLLYEDGPQAGFSEEFQLHRCPRKPRQEFAFSAQAESRPFGQLDNPQMRLPVFVSTNGGHARAEGADSPGKLDELTDKPGDARNVVII